MVGNIGTHPILSKKPAMLGSEKWDVFLTAADRVAI